MRHRRVNYIVKTIFLAAALISGNRDNRSIQVKIRIKKPVKKDPLPDGPGSGRKKIVVQKRKTLF